jgi:hypothetical protein
MEVRRVFYTRAAAWVGSLVPEPVSRTRAGLFSGLGRRCVVADDPAAVPPGEVAPGQAGQGGDLVAAAEQAYDLVIKVATGELDQVEEIAAILQAATAPRP